MLISSDKDVINLMTATADRYECDLVVFSNWGQAVSYMKDSSPDKLFIDAGTAGCDVVDLFRCALAMHPDIDVVLMSDSVCENMRRSMASVGFALYINRLPVIDHLSKMFKCLSISPKYEKTGSTDHPFYGIGQS